MKPIDEKLGLDDLDDREEIELEDIIIESKGIGNDLEDDYKIIRTAIITAIKRADEVLTESVKSIKMSGGSPREIEASASILKTLSENSKNLLDMHNSINSLSKTEDGDENKNTGTKATLAEVVKLVKNS